MSITISIENSPAPIPTITVPWAAGMTVQQALESAYNQTQQTTPGGFRYGLEFYGTFQDPPFGYMVVMVDGVADEPDQESFWALLINGVFASRGIDYTTLADGDRVTLSNEVYNEETHGATHVAVKRAGHAAAAAR